MNTWGAIILAAGQSKRLGQPKQLLLFQGKTLLEHALDAIRPLVGERYRVVLGAYEQEILNALSPQHFHHISNPSWESGMASSLQIGLQDLLREASIDGIFLVVSDQPFVDVTIVNKLLNKHLQSDKNLIASTYGDTIGVPAFIHSSYFGQLLELTHDAGAKKLFYTFPQDLATIPFPQGSVDVDTLEDYQRLIQSQT
jgi:molybdenum cofactor cytidylyltransferase